MCSRHLKADFVCAWTSAEIAVMGPAGAANIIFRKEINAAEDKESVRNAKIEEYKEKFANPYVAAANGYVDAVIDPNDTRESLIKAMRITESKVVESVKKKHGVVPF